MSDLTFTLVSDGPSDEALLRPLDWLLQQHVNQDTTIQPVWADLRSLRRRPPDLTARIDAALNLYPCEILFVHRDAERENPDRRYQEIQAALDNTTATLPPTLCVVPVRMQETWLLFNEAAIRLAAGNPNSRVPLKLPRLSEMERIPNPKDVLYELLRTASELSGRRLKKFSESHGARRAAEYVDDYAPLRQLRAFERLENELAAAVRNNGW